MGSETAFLGAGKFKNFILLLQLVFELGRFESPIGILVFLLGNPYPWTDCSKTCTKVVPYAPNLSSEFQVSTLSHFEVIAICPLVAEKL